MPGLIAGAFGGLLFGAAMSHLGALGPIASLLHARSPLVGFAIHMSLAVFLGGGFGLLVLPQRPIPGGILFWGLTYGTLWWFVGALTLMPLLLGNGLAWDLASAQAAIPSLFGHWVYGAGMALALMILCGGELRREPIRVSVLLQGAGAGLMGGALLRWMLISQQGWAEVGALFGGSGPGWLIIGLGGVAGGAFAALYPSLAGSAGVSLIRGTGFGFFCWIVTTRTLGPLLTAGRLAWSLEDARQGFASLPAYVLFGAALALLYKTIRQVQDFLFSDVLPRAEHQGIAARTLRAVLRGALAGLVGSVLFTLVMVQVGILPRVAKIVGSASPWTGFFIHLLIANIVGASYGLMFRNQSYDVGSSLGWGISYGLFWWFLGPLTLMPIFLGMSPHWTAAVAGGVLDSLIGHLAYGAGLGLTFHHLESRYSPWWIPHRQAEAERIKRQKEMMRTSAPALWTLMVVMTLLLPLILGQ